MRQRGRMPKSVLPLLFIVAFTVAAGSDYGVPIEIKLWDTGRTPIAHMVDVTNGFGLKILAEHNFLNDNNIAFSPYGLMGIMVALYEGIDGESSYQIQRGMQLPWNRNIMRIGFRDIHRTLKTYFVPEEGFLAGLALNNENVTFNESYKKILRFYGFDLENDQLPTLPPQTNNTNAMNANGTTAITPTMTTEISGTPTLGTSTEGMTAREDFATTTTPSETIPDSSTATVNEIDIRGPTPTGSPPAASNGENAAGTTAIPTTADQVVTKDQMSTTTVGITTTEVTNSITLPTTSEATTAISGTNEQTTIISQTIPTTTIGPTDEPTVNNEVEILTTPDGGVNAAGDSNNSETMSVPEEGASTTAIGETDNTATTVMENQQTEQMLTDSDMNTLMDTTTNDMANETSTLETLERRKKSIVDFIFTSPPYLDDYIYYRSYDIPAPSLSIDDDKTFLANGLKNIQVSYMHYDTILEHAYLSHLEASALRLPLDSERYYLLVILPTRGGAPELGRLLARMARESDLRDVYEALQPRRVRAIVPSFVVKGHVTLTTDLQKLGIRDVFEPRQRDFTPMTPQGGVYVRSIEQAVSVAIRKYKPDDQKKNRYVINRQPVHFSATYPFLYFVMDATIHVALMAGKMVDPLNTRIL